MNAEKRAEIERLINLHTKNYPGFLWAVRNRYCMAGELADFDAPEGGRLGRNLRTALERGTAEELAMILACPGMAERLLTHEALAYCMRFGSPQAQSIIKPLVASANAAQRRAERFWCCLHAAAGVALAVCMTATLAHYLGF